MTNKKFNTAMRDCMCGNIDLSMEGTNIKICGWVKKTRNHGNLIFLDIRDRSGIVQVFSNDTDMINKLSSARLEDVISINGAVLKRPDEMINSDMKTGAIEIECKSFEMLSKSEVTPFVIEEDIKASEQLRLKYRYLDLRRDYMLNIFEKRSLTYQVIREYLNENGFLEIETPVLSKSTPEGARDYIVPSRVHKGKFYALVQSPQLYKQILMVSGFDRYYQFARCYRDEDLRADRQPEHTQIDIEMSFVEKEDIFKITEEMMKHLFIKVLNRNIDIPFEVLTYDKSMLLYGTDKPDARFENTIIDITVQAQESESHIIKNSEFTGALIFEEEFPRKEIDRLTEFVKSAGAAGLGYLKMKDGNVSGPFAKFLDSSTLISNNGVMFIMSGKRNKTLQHLGLLRKKIGDCKKLYNKDIFKFLWIIDYPLFEWNEEENKYEPCHHMFTMPKKEFIGKIKEDPLSVKGELYDLVCNGVEVASGSIRIHKVEIQKEIMAIVGFDEESVNEKFGFLLEAFKYGAPPHGGIAPGIDRLVMLMLGLDNIRDVIAFPKTLNAIGLMENCPSTISKRQLEELAISVREKNNEN